jgi:4-amino-4-deoxy-L-arabinose transferase-like glycosyltransferase
VSEEFAQASPLPGTPVSVEHERNPAPAGRGALPARHDRSPAPPEAGAEAWRFGRAARWMVRAAWALVFIVASLGILSALDRDEGAFLVIAQEILHGRLPYRDVFDHKSPGIYYVLAASLALTSHFNVAVQVVAARLTVVLANLLTALGIASLGRRWWDAQAGALAALLWLIVFPAFSGDQLLTEPFATAATVWAVYVLTRHPDRRGAFAAGMLLALATVFKQTTVLALPVLALMIVLQRPARAEWRPLARDVLPPLGMLFLGLAAPWVVVCALFASAGALGPMVSQVLVANLVHYPADPASVKTVDLNRAVTRLALLWAAPLLTLLAGPVRRLRLRASPRLSLSRLPHLGSGTALAAMLAALHLIPLVAHTYLHYWLQVLPWIALLLGAGVIAEVRSWRTARGGQRGSRPPRTLFIASGLVAITVVIGAVISLELAAPELAALQQESAAGAWIAGHTMPGTRLLVLPAEPEYYYLSGRLPTTWYIYVLPINDYATPPSQVSAQIAAGEFDVVIWQTNADGQVNQVLQPGIYGALTRRYQRLAVEEHEGLELFVPRPQKASG